LHLAAVSSANCVTISGPSPSLAKFKDEFVPNTSITARYANISVLFHGGQVMEEVMEQVLADFSRRNIKFPGFEDLRAPLRCTVEGGVFRPAVYSRSKTLLEKVLEMILIHPVDWETTFAGVKETMGEMGEVDVLSFGPGSVSSLCGPAAGYASTPGVRAVDVSVTPNVLEKEKPAPGKDDIAIVGMGVKFPKGNNPDELWDTLMQGLNTVAEVSFSSSLAFETVLNC
jgi:malonyl CoA-acyl carrier protein transacylase